MESLMDLDEYFKREPIADRGISVVMPAFNEAECLESAISRLANVLEGLGHGYEIIVVDDGSTDGTGEVAQRLSPSNRRIRVIGHATHLGYGAALRCGFQAAKYPLVLQLDSDDQYAPSDIERLLGAIDQTDVVCGYRAARRGDWRSRLRDWFYRRLVSIVFAVRVRDVDCGFKLYRRAAVRRIPIQSAGRFANAEILAKANFMSMLIGEVPVSHQPRGCGVGQRPREPFTQRLREAARVFWHPQFATPSARSDQTAAVRAA
jgi:glycosyltransferase involved in cell wall biosynthesis